MSVAHFKADDELMSFARKFFANRIETFRKDIAICLTPNARWRARIFSGADYLYCVRRSIEWLVMLVGCIAMD